MRTSLLALGALLDREGIIALTHFELLVDFLTHANLKWQSLSAT